MRLFCLLAVAFFVFPSTFVTAQESSADEDAAEQRKELDFAEEIEAANKANLDKIREQRRKNVDERRKLREEDEADKKQKIKEFNDKFDPRLSATVNVDGKDYPVDEPRSPEEVIKKKDVADLYEVSPDDFDILKHSRWALNKSDFQFDEPFYVTADIRAGRSKTWFGFTFDVTNSTDVPRLILPVFTCVTENDAFFTASGGFIPERIAADSKFQPLAAVRNEEIRDKILKGQNVPSLEPSWRQALFTADGKESFKPNRSATFAPGEVRHGAAFWSEFTNEFTELKVIVHGLTNSHRLDRNERRVLVLAFKRNDDEFHTHHAELKYVNKEWDWQWMWDRDINVPLPPNPNTPRLETIELDTPTGAKKLLWAFPYTVKNSTAKTQYLVLKQIRHELSGEDRTGLAADVGGQKVMILLRANDDGFSSIYKAKFLRDKNQYDPIRSRNRFLPPQTSEDPGPFAVNNRYKLEPGTELAESMAVFDIDDVDWEDAFTQAEDQLTAASDKKALSEAQWKAATEKAAALGGQPGENPGLLYPRRRLSDDEKSALRKQLTEAIPAALEAAKAKKTITAIFKAESGLSSGQYRITRSWRIPGVIQKEWTDAWMTIDVKPVH
jgi:hypothetical protein